MIVYLLDACGPQRRWSGVSGDEDAARQAAEALLLGGDASAAKVEKAFAMLGTRMLETGYRRTGEGWRAQRGRGDAITWEPLTVARDGSGDGLRAVIGTTEEVRRAIAPGNISET